MTIFIAIVRRLSQACGFLAVALLVASVLVVCQLVFVRYILGQSAIWQHEFVTYGLIAATFIGSPYVLLTRGHVNVDLLPIYLGRRGRRALAFLASGIALVFCLVLLWSGIEWWHESWAGGWHAETLWAPPVWILRLSLPLGMGILALQYVADIVALASGRAAPFGISDEDGA